MFIYEKGKDQKGSVNWIVVGFLGVLFALILGDLVYEYVDPDVN